MEKANIGENGSKVSCAKNIFSYIIIGVFVGMLVAGIMVWTMMPGMMLTTHFSRYGTVEETCEKLKESIGAEGWSCPAIRDMNKAMMKGGVQFDSPCRIVELCKAKYAKDVLTTNPEVLTLMPCAWGVYKNRAGNVCITGMNMGLMGKMFGGNIAKVMGGKVSSDETRMLARVIKP